MQIDKSGPFIDRSYRLRFVSQFCICVLAVAVISLSAFYYLTDTETGITYYQALLTLNGLRQNILPATVLTGLTVTIVITAAVLTITLFGSHKIAGPIYRLERSLESIGNGDLTLKIKFRPSDAIGGLAEEINSLTSNLNEKISDINGTLKDIRKEIEGIGINTDQPSAALIEKVGLIKKAMSNFKTE